MRWPLTKRRSWSTRIQIRQLAGVLHACFVT